jgi:virulence factor Mce-like protein
MRRLVATALMALVATGAGALVLGSRAGAASDYRVDVIFDSARGVIPGQLVKVAGAPVGSIKDVKVTPGYRARIELEVDSRFAPFKADARCSIQPEGLIAEYFVQCDPGTAGARPLRAGGGRPPTVPVERTTLPVGLMDLFELADVPVRDRARVLINELGIGLIARGDDLNAILRRSNPALQQARRGIALLNRQRADLDRIVRSTDRVAASLARRRGRVQDFIRGAARVTEVTGSRNAELSEAVRRLPELLRATQPALQAIDQFSADAEPLLGEVRAAAPGVARSLRNLRTFADTSAEPLRGLRSTLVRGRRAARTAAPFTRRLNRFLGEAPATIGLVADLFGDLDRRGFPANLLELFYYGAAMSARYDQYGHILPSRLLDLPECGAYATTPVAGCEARPGRSAARAPRARRRKRPAARRPAPVRRAPAPRAPSGRRAPAPAPQRRRPLAPLPVQPPEQLPDELEDLLEYLLK